MPVTGYTKISKSLNSVGWHHTFVFVGGTIGTQHMQQQNARMHTHGHSDKHVHIQTFMERLKHSRSGKVDMIFGLKTLVYFK